MKYRLQTSPSEAKTRDILNQQIINIIIPHFDNSIQRIF